MTNAPTLVTAVFDLGSEPLARRRISDLLSLDAPMAVYTDKGHAGLVRELRGDRPTRTHLIDPAELTRAELYRPLMRSGAADRVAIELTKPLWLLQQAQQNPFSSSHLYWTDAALGLSTASSLSHGNPFPRLARRHGRFLLLCRPRSAEKEANSLDAGELSRRAGVDRTRWVASGELFGGATASVLEVGARYSQHVDGALADGCLGDVTSLLTLQSYTDAEHFDLHFLGRDGKLEPFFTRLAEGWPGDVGGARALLPDLVETWFLSFHAPRQLQRLLESIETTEPDLLRTARRVLINNSVDPSYFAAYDALCERYGLEQVREGNRGFNGARMRAAELFSRGGRHAMFWLEDDMLLVAEDDPVQQCESGLPRHVHGLASASAAVLQREFADYVKLSFTEKHRAHDNQVAWAFLDENARKHYFPDALEPPPQRVSAIQRAGHVSYAVAEANYSNWPQLMTRRGTQKIFFEERREPCLEPYWAARSFEMLRQGCLRATVLLASPIENRRVQDYPSAERVVYQRVEDKPLVAPPVEAPPARSQRDWPLQPGHIFVAIAAYRDSETPHTLRDLFTRASHPERVFAGVFSQVVPGTDDDCLPGFIAHGAPEGHVRELRAHAADSLGACWARNRVFELLQGEEFVLQIDSHSRFETGWDETLVEMVRNCATPRALLTTYPPSYTLPDTRSTGSSSVIAANYFDNMGILVARARLFDPLRPPRAPVPSAFLSAGFLFGPAAAFREVPYDPHLYFHGEEPSLAVRFWTHGWDLFAPHRTVLYHDYSADRGRPRNWEDRRDWVALNMRSVARLRHLFGIEQSRDPKALREIDRYGLGEARTLQEYEEYADLRFATSRIGPRAADARFPEPAPESSLRMLRAARARYLAGLTGERDLPEQETRSGEDSTMLATLHLRGALGKWLRENETRSLIDAGCGDFHWMRAVDLGGLDRYAGYDIVPELIARNQQLYGGRRGHYFTVGDIARTPLPACDAILCRRVLEEMPEEEALRALEGFRNSGARYLLATLRAGTPRGRDLLSAPYNLPQPLTVLRDGRDTVLAIWALARR